MSVDFIILAAGNSSRMNSSKPKFFHTIAGKPIIRYIIDTVKDCKISNNVIVVTKDNLKSSGYFSDVNVTIQHAPLGTADAVKSSLDKLTSEYTIILCGDMPLIETAQLNNLISNSSENAIIAMNLPSSLQDMPYGRVIINNGIFEKIVEYKNASKNEKSIRLANTGVYKIRTALLKKYIPMIKQNSQSGEFYLTDIFNFIKNVEIITTDNYEDFHGINTMSDLAIAENIMQNRLRTKYMSQGVNLIDPSSVYFSFDTTIYKDVTIEPNVFIGTCVSIGEKSIIHAFSHIYDCCIGECVQIGPFARIRGNSNFKSGVVIGNFVEVKGSSFDENSKAKHLTYIGDTTIGKASNIGAGTITCNYDGVKKHKSTIGDNVFIGSNTTIISPITIDNGAIVGAGSVITKNVEENSLAIARAPQQNFQNKAPTIWEKKFHS